MPSRPHEFAIVPVRVKPGASRTRVGGRYDGPNGPALIAAVQSPAVDGRATESARRAIAEALGVPSSTVELRTGAAARDKLFTVLDPPADLTERIIALRDGSA